jgi:hypothetical protein
MENPLIAYTAVTFSAIVVSGALIAWLLYLHTLNRTLAAVRPECRAIQPKRVWLLLIPWFNLGWHFHVVEKITESVEKEFAFRRIADCGSCGERIGILQSAFALFCLIPPFAVICFPAAVGFWSAYWVRIAGIRRRLAIAEKAPNDGNALPPPL